MLCLIVATRVQGGRPSTAAAPGSDVLQRRWLRDRRPSSLAVATPSPGEWADRLRQAAPAGRPTSHHLADAAVVPHLGLLADRPTSPFPVNSSALVGPASAAGPTGAAQSLRQPLPDPQDQGLREDSLPGRRRHRVAWEGERGSVSGRWRGRGSRADGGKVVQETSGANAGGGDSHRSGDPDAELRGTRGCVTPCRVRVLLSPFSVSSVTGESR